MMFKLFVFIGLIVSISGCGVDTSSATVETVVNVESSDNTTVIPDAIDPNPVYTDELNTTTDDTNTTTTDDTNTTVVVPVNVDQNNSIFDTSAAVKDQFACTIGDNNAGYTNNTIKDSSNDFLSTSDLEYGVSVTSNYPYNADITKTEVILYYYDLKPVRTMVVKSIFEDNYSISIDTAWANNEEPFVYVRTPKDSDDLYGCYRYDIGSIDNDGNYTVTKVYRVNEQ